MRNHGTHTGWSSQGRRGRLVALLAGVLALGAPAAAAQTAAGPEEAAAPTRMLRLRDGATLFGAVVEHAPDELRFRRLDNGGLVKLPWSFLDPEEAAKLRLAYGYVDSEREELLVDATRVRLVDGTELVGHVDTVRSTSEYLWLKRSSGSVPLARASLQASTLTRVPALDVFTKEELYLRRAAELGGALTRAGREGAEAHDQLARYCERVFDFAHAAEHYRYAADLDPAYEAARITDALERSERKAALADQVELLSEIDLWRVRQRYDRAFEALELFPRLYPDSPLMEDWSAARRSVERSQKRDVAEAIVRRVHASVVELARRAAREKKTNDEVLAYLDEVMQRDLFLDVQAELEELAPGIGTGDVESLWRERSGGRYKQVSYGLGTWLLGEARALETYEDEESETEAPTRGSQREAREKLEQRIEQYLRNQELALKGGTSKRDEDDPEAFWKNWDFSGRYNWIAAYFVEFSGLFRIEGVRLSNCRECGGTGARELLFTGSAVSGRSANRALVPCPTCHTIGRVRRVRYR